MSQITLVESRSPLRQLVVENRDVDRDFYILSILAAFAREEMETQSGEESKRCFAEKERKSVGDVREHNRLVEILEEIGVPVAYMEFDGESPELPYIIFSTTIEEETGRIGERSIDYYHISVNTREKDYLRLEKRMEQVLEQNGYQIEKKYSIMNITPDEHRILFCVLGKA